MYLMLMILLFICALIEIYMRKNIKGEFFLFAVLITIMLCLRYGQGTDYYAYFLQYEYIDVNHSLSEVVNYNMHGELGWRILIWIVKRAGASYELFIGILSIVMMLGTTRAIKKYSPFRTVSLLLMYPTYILTYFSSGLRQGGVLSLFLGFGLSWLLNREYKKYYVLVAMFTLFHTSALVLFLLPTVIWIYEQNKQGVIYILCIIVAFLGYFGLLNVVARYIPGVSSYLAISISIPAVLVRLLFFVLVYWMHSKISCDDLIENKLYMIYMFGMVLFFALSFSSNLSQRLTMPLKAIEIVLIPIQLKYLMFGYMRMTRKRRSRAAITLSRSSLIALCSVVVLILPVVEYVKNINSYIEQGNYHDSVNVINYPYFSIWDKDNVGNYVFHFNEQME